MSNVIVIDGVRVLWSFHGILCLLQRRVVRIKGTEDSIVLGVWEIRKHQTRGRQLRQTHGRRGARIAERATRHFINLYSCLNSLHEVVHL